MTIHIRLWVSNQDVIGADSDNTDGHLDDLKWKHGSVVGVPAFRKSLTEWFMYKFLPLQSRAAADGWGGDDTEHLPPPILTAFALGGHFESARTLMQIYSTEGNCEAWVDAVLEVAKEKAAHAQ